MSDWMEELPLELWAKWWGSGDGDSWGLKLLWDPRDLWVGLYWKISYDLGGAQRVYEFYFNIIPTLPILLLRTEMRGE